MAKYFPLANMAKFRHDITTFTQWKNGSLYKTWKHFKDLFRKCFHHDLPIWLQIQTFNGLGATDRFMLYATVGGALMRKIAKEPYGLLEELASNNYQRSMEKTMEK